MKHKDIYSYMSFFCLQLQRAKDSDSSLLLNNFHPAFIFLLLKHSKDNFVFYFENGSLDSFSYIFNDHISSGESMLLPYFNETDSPFEFRSDNKINTMAAISALFSNLSFRLILTEKGVEKTSFRNNLSKKAPYKFSSLSSREELLVWVKENNYKRVDFVYSPGEYSERGGIVDVFSYSLKRPLRINFFDEIPLLSLFSTDSQLFYKTVSSYMLNVYTEGEDLFVFSKIVHNKYIPVYINNGSACFYKKDSCFSLSVPFKYFSFNSFLKNNKGSTVIVDNYLKNFSIFFNNVFIVPSDFSTKNTPAKNNILSVGDFNVGDFFVHKKFGVGSFCGLKLSRDGSTEQFVLKYSNNEFVNISVENMDSISFFAPSYESAVVLDSLAGKGSWSRKVSKVKKEISTVVDSILLSMSERSKVFRAPYNVDGGDLNFFLDAFSYIDTKDQRTSWNDIYKDLCSTSPMNRLLCGDVGFGKTELAMRSSFVVSFTKQVAIMAPTTILSLQLFRSFKERFKNFPQNIGLLNRLQTTNENILTYKNLSNGSIDIIIGTHALLSERVSFNALGLVIIDEEHRFGVKQKEKISSLSLDLDILLMSATPIPRSLQQSFSGLKSLSLMKSPPLMRKPIITKILYSSNAVLSKFINMEISRRGQVYIVYNNVDNIENYTNKIINLFPGLSVSYIHGKLSSSKIEKTLSLFINNLLDVLICSSIIEAGIDVPNTNTILIENSHNFGLAQLYQLRGRVGRSSEQAFAVLLIPKNYTLSSISKNRLKTIKKNNALGSGFEVAKKDLTIRGSGSVFGYSQSGSFSYIGRELYSQLVKESIEKSSLNNSLLRLPINSIVVNIYNNILIEASFVSNQHLRFDIYKKIFSSLSLDSLNNIEKEILDRFGILSDGLFCLFNTQKIRILCALLGIKNIVLSSGSFLTIVFSNKIKNIDSLLMVSNNYFFSLGTKFKLNSSSINSLVLQIEVTNDFNVFSFLYKYLNKLLQ